jgi:hypothetical protein
MPDDVANVHQGLRLLLSPRPLPGARASLTATSF